MEQKEFEKVENTGAVEASSHENTRQQCDESSDEEIRVISSDEEEKHKLRHHSRSPSEQAMLSTPQVPQKPQASAFLLPLQAPVPLLDLFRPWQTQTLQIRRPSVSEALQDKQQNIFKVPNATGIALDNHRMEQVLPQPSTSASLDYSMRSEVASALQETSNDVSAESVPNRLGFMDSMVKFFTRNDEWPIYSCSMCNKKFNYKCDLVNHMRKHTGEKPFQCSHCSHRSSLKCNMKLHERTHSDERPFKCLTCGQAFKLKSTLNTHQKVHSGEMPFTCDICKKSYRNKDQRNIRTGERSNVCNVCNEKFRASCELSKQRQLHKKEEKRRCTI